MGYMACVTIRNSDLGQIAIDTQFGKRIASALNMFDVAEYYMAKNWDRQTASVSTADLHRFEIDRDRTPSQQSSVEFFVSKPVHADVETLHIIRDGRQISPRPHTFQHYQDAVALAEAMAAMGYRTKDVVTGDVRGDLEPVERSMADYMHHWNTEELLSEGTTTISVLMDGISSVSKDETFGANLAQHIRDYIRIMEEHSKAFDSGEIKGHVFSYDTVSAGNHCNPVQIVCVTPPGETDVLVLGQNWGRELRPVRSICQMTGDEKHLAHINKLLERSRRKMVDMMISAGFQVRLPGRSRSESVPEWTKVDWPKRPEESPDVANEP